MAQGTPETWRFDAASVKTIRVSAGAGPIELKTAPGPDIKAALSGEYEPDACEITAEVRGDELVLEARGRKKGFWSWRRQNCRAGFSVSAPADKPLIIKNGAGDVRIGDFTAGADIASGAGRVELVRTSGPLKISSGAGSISGELYSEDFKLSSGAGSTDLAWTKAPKAGRISFYSGAGLIKLAFPGDSRLNVQHSTGAGSFRNGLGSDPSAPVTLVIRSGAGNVEISKS